MAELKIRDARVTDADGVARVHVRTWQAAYRGLIEQAILDGLSIEDRAQSWHRNIAAPLPTTIGLLVGIRSDEIVGWISFGSGRDADGLADGEVYGLYADPSSWSSGVGHALLDAAEQRLAAAGHTSAYLWVLDGNERADTFYQRHGWLADGATRVEERPGHTLAEHRRTKRLLASTIGR